MRKKIVEEQRKDPKLLKLIQALEREERNEASADAAVEQKQGERRDLVDIAMQDDSTSLFKLIGNDKVLVKAVSFRPTRASDTGQLWCQILSSRQFSAFFTVTSRLCATLENTRLMALSEQDSHGKDW